MKFPYYKQLDSMDCGPSCQMAQGTELRAQSNLLLRWLVDSEVKEWLSVKHGEPYSVQRTRIKNQILCTALWANRTVPARPLSSLNLKDMNDYNTKHMIRNQQKLIINPKVKGRGFALCPVPLALSFSPLPRPFSHKKGGVSMQR